MKASGQPRVCYFVYFFVLDTFVEMLLPMESLFCFVL